MVTSQQFDEVLVPVDYQDNVIMRTFNMLTGGFNKKNKKGKFMKAIKEEWENGKWVEKTTAQKEAEERHKKFQDKVKSGEIKVINLDKKKKTSTTASEAKAEAKKKSVELYKGYLLNKVGKTLGEIEKERKAKISGKVKEEIEEPGDTQYTTKEIAEIVFPRSKKVRELYLSTNSFRDALLKDEALRKEWDEKVIKAKGSKPEKKTRTVKTAVQKVKEVELETDLTKIATWFWNHKDDKSFKSVFGNDVKSYQQLFRRIKNDDRGLKYFAELMKMAGYKKEKETPAVTKVTLIKKNPEAACDWEKEGEAAKEFEGNDVDKIWNASKSFFTSWAKEHGYKLTAEALKAFKDNVFKTIVYYNTMSILKGNK